MDLKEIINRQSKHKTKGLVEYPQQEMEFAVQEYIFIHKGEMAEINILKYIENNDMFKHLLLQSQLSMLDSYFICAQHWLLNNGYRN